MARRRLQMRGDPPIRRFLFSQTRVNNEFDSHLEEVLDTVELLLRERGIFHAKIHFSSGQVTLWSMADPYNYQVYLKPEFLAPGFTDTFPACCYPINASVPPGHIRGVLDILRTLRSMDDPVYLRSGSLNIINGKVGLVFSHEGTHYIDYLKFLRYRDDVYG